MNENKDKRYAGSYNFEQNCYDITLLEDAISTNSKHILNGEPFNIWMVITIGSQEHCRTMLECCKAEMERLIGTDRLMDVIDIDEAKIKMYRLEHTYAIKDGELIYIDVFDGNLLFAYPCKITDKDNVTYDPRDQFYIGENELSELKIISKGE